MDEVEFHAPPRESKSKRWLSFHPFSGMYIQYVTDRNKEGKAERKRFNQIAAKWLNRSAVGALCVWHVGY